MKQEGQTGEKRKRTYPQRAKFVVGALMRALGCPEQLRLIRLWENWSMVLGEDIASLAWPLGHREKILLVGGEDPMAMQELQFFGPEILERVNAFMEEPFFEKVKVTLCMGKRPLDAPVEEAPVYRPQAEGPRPSGARLAGMRPDSPVARAYARFAGLPFPESGNGTPQAG